jgi:hypothetical protein
MFWGLVKQSIDARRIASGKFEYLADHLQD